MASRDNRLDLDLNDPDQAEAWVRQFAATARTKNAKDADGDGVKGITDLFLSKAGLPSIRTLSLMAAPNELEDMPFKDIRALILETIRPKKKLVIAERTNFLSLKQENGETVQMYYQRLRAASKFCEFDKLGDKMSKENELIIMRIIDGLAIPAQKTRMLEKMQDNDMTLEQVLVTLQQMDLINLYNASSGSTTSSENATAVSVHSTAMEDKNRFRNSDKTKCGYCGSSHMRGKCPAFGKTCRNCQKKNHFESVCKSDKNKKMHFQCADDRERQVKHDSEAEEGQATVFSMTISNNCGINSIGKAVYKMVKVQNLEMKMQVDTGADISVLPRNFWEMLGKPKLRRSQKTLKNFDNSTIKCLGEITLCPRWKRYSLKLLGTNGLQNLICLTPTYK